VSITKGVRRRDETSGPTRAAAEDLSSYKACRTGNLVINRMRAFQGALGIAPEDGIVSPDYSVLQLSPRVEPRWLSYFLTSGSTVAEMASLVRGIGGTEAGNVRTPRLNVSDLYTIRTDLKPLDEQRAIADYLDRETARIDTLIEEQQRLIEMLRDRKQAAIEHAVFRGLGDVELGENEEPWLPLTPAHWTKVQLGFITDTLAGYAFPSDGFSSHPKHLKLVRGVNIKPGRIDWSDAVYWDLEDSPVGPEYLLSPGDLVLGMDRPFVSGGVRVASIAAEDTPALLLQRVMRLRPKDGCDRSYLRYVVSTGAFLTYLEPLFTGVSVPHMSEWQVRKFKMPLPPLDEQRRIADHLDEQTTQIEALIAEIEAFIELSRERRSALITVAVTGQIDVRGVA
jgi:type I restriction enzyme S subunit